MRRLGEVVGEMIETVTFEKTTFNPLPHKFEAGTPHIEGVIALGAAIRWMEDIGIENIQTCEEELRAYATAELKKIDGMRIIADVEPKAAVVSFLVGDIHPYDIGTLLDQMGIAVRTGHHCTQPLMDHFKIPGTVRASFAVYNTKEEVDALVEGVRRSVSILL